MRLRKLFALMLCICLLPLCAAAAEDGTVTLTVGGRTFSASPDATELDLGDLALPDTDEAYAALEEFLRQLPLLTRLDMFSTDIPVNRVLYLGEKYARIRIAAQRSQKEFEALCDHTLVNNGSEEILVSCYFNR